MLLLIDIGNTNITMCFYDKSVKHVSRLNTLPARDRREYAIILEGFMLHNHISGVKGAVVCSVVPEIIPAFVSVLKDVCRIKPLIVSHKLKTGLKFRIKNPEALGADRIANAAAAFSLYKGNLIVIDFGTTTTFCLITEKGEYMGGAIMPGLDISADVLHEKTAKLPRVSPSAPMKIIGDDTKSNILSGLVLGHAGAVERLIKEFKTEIGGKVNIIATGGLSGIVLPYIKTVKKANANLTFEGLRLIYELNA